MQIINAAPKSEHNCADHQHDESAIDNPAANYGEYHAEFGYEKMEASPLQAPEVPEIKVNGVLIDEPSILEEMQHHPADNKRAAMIKAAESVIIGELLTQKAKELGLLAADASKNSIGEAAALQKLLEQEVDVPTASEEECARFYEHNTQHFATSPLLEVRHILLAASPEDMNARYQLKDVADKLIEILKADKSAFADLVSRHSACPSKEQKGSLGQLSKGQTVAEFEKHIFSANEGLIEYPIESRYGYHIVIVDRKVEGQVLPYQYVKEKVAEYLNDKVQRKATAQYIHTLITDADITGFVFDVDSSPLIQ